jgi:photosystem II stability/assembly factor-like uncharacterized protein
MFRLPKLPFVYFMVGFFLITSCTESPSINSNKDSKTVLRKRKKLAKQDRIDLAMRQEFLMTMDPALRTVPRERLTAAQAYKARLMSLSRLTDLSWQERGPNNVAGRTRAMIIDRRDATGNTIIAGGVGGGVWRTTSFKTAPSWVPLGDKLSNLAVCALAQDPSAPATMYAGTGEGWFNIDAIRGQGIFKSIDGGTTWAQLPSTVSTVMNTSAYRAFDYVQDIVVNSNGIIFAATRTGSNTCNRGGVLRSIDGGGSWSQVIGDVRGTTCSDAYNYLGADLEIAVNGDIYATAGFGSTDENELGRIFRSTAANAGAAGTWTDITPEGTWERIEIACAPSDQNVLYALLEKNNKIGAIMRSGDAGATWQTLTIPEWCDQGDASTDFTRDQAWYDLIVQVDPNNANTVIIGGIDLLKSTDGGTTWRQITQWNARCSTLPVVHADQHNILFYTGSSNEFIASNDGGIYYTNNGGTSWTAKNNNYNITQFYSVDMHPSTSNYFLFGAQDNGTKLLTSAGMNAAINIANGDGGFAHIDQTNNGLIQVGAFTNNNYFYTWNGGTNWELVSGDNDEGLFINPTDFDDALDRLYTANGEDKMGIVTGLNARETSKFNEVILTGLSGQEISAIKVDPTVPAGGTAWVAGFGGMPAIYKITNLSTLTPTVGPARPLPSLSGAFISSIDVDPANADHLLVTLSNFGIISVFESVNGGVSWSNIEGNLPDMPVRWGLFVPSSASVNGVAPGGVLLATELGVWYTSQTAGAATNWVPQSNGLPNTRIDMLKLRNSDLLLAAATHGRGLFTTNITSLTTGLNPTPNTTGFIQYINANQQELFIKVGNLTTAKVEVRIYNAKGQLVLSSNNRYVDQRIPLQQLAGGVYVVKIKGNKEEHFTHRFVK